MSSPFNPMTAMFKGIMGNGEDAVFYKRLSTAEKHRSNALNVTVGMEQAGDTPAGGMGQGGTGKFKVCKHGCFDASVSLPALALAISKLNVYILYTLSMYSMYTFYFNSEESRIAVQTP